MPKARGNVTLGEVQNSLRQLGLGSANLVVAIDFTKSNERTGEFSFGGRCLHEVAGGVFNPYQQVINIVGRTLSQPHDPHGIPCYGFGDVSTQDSTVFSFYAGDQPCRGLKNVLDRYKQLVPRTKLSGPSSFAPAINQAIKIVRNSGGQFHVLLLIADGQVTPSADPDSGQLSPQEQSTVHAIVAASHYPLSIIVVGVGDGPWDTMEEYDHRLPHRAFDNFRFVNFTEVMSRHYSSAQEFEDAFALEALWEIPDQYRAMQRLRILGAAPPGPPSPVVLDPPSGLEAFPTGVVMPKIPSRPPSQPPSRTPTPPSSRTATPPRDSSPPRWAIPNGSHSANVPPFPLPSWALPTAPPAAPNPSYPPYPSKPASQPNGYAGGTPAYQTYPSMPGSQPNGYPGGGPSGPQPSRYSDVPGAAPAGYPPLPGPPLAGYPSASDPRPSGYPSQDPPPSSYPPVPTGMQPSTYGSSTPGGPPAGYPTAVPTYPAVTGPPPDGYPTPPGSPPHAMHSFPGSSGPPPPAYPSPPGTPPSRQPAPSGPPSGSYPSPPGTPPAGYAPPLGPPPAGYPTPPPPAQSPGSYGTAFSFATWELPQPGPRPPQPYPATSQAPYPNGIEAPYPNGLSGPYSGTAPAPTQYPAVAHARPPSAPAPYPDMGYGRTDTHAAWAAAAAAPLPSSSSEEPSAPPLPAYLQDGPQSPSQSRSLGPELGSYRSLPEAAETRCDPPPHMWAIQ